MALLTQQEAAQQLGVTVRTLQNWTKAGRVKSKKVGRVRYYDSATLSSPTKPSKKRPRVSQRECLNAVASAPTPKKGKAPALIRKRGSGWDPDEPMCHVGPGPEGHGYLIPNNDAADFPDTLEAYLCEDDPSQVEVRLFDKVRRVFAGERLVFPGKSGHAHSNVEYERAGGRFEQASRGRVYIRYVRVDARRRVIESTGQVLGVGGGPRVVVPKGGYSI